MFRCSGVVHSGRDFEGVIECCFLSLDCFEDGVIQEVLRISEE